MKITLKEIKRIVKTALNEQVVAPAKNDLYYDALENLERDAKEAAVNEELDVFYEKGDDGIGEYEYGSQRGFDSHPYNEVSVSGQKSFSWQGDVDVESFEAQVLIDNAHDVDIQFTLKGQRTYVPEDDESNAVFEYYGSATLSSAYDDHDGYDRADRDWSDR